MPYKFKIGLSNLNNNEQIFKILKRQKNNVYSNTLTSFIYLNGGAKHFQDWVLNPNYKSHKIECDLIPKVFSNFENNFLNIVDLGLGIGDKALLVLKKFKDSNYIGLDISEQMINIAKNHQKDFLKNNSINYKYICCDFTNKEYLQENIENLENPLFLILGNTISNIISIDIFLDYIKNLLYLKQGKLLIGIELFDKNVDDLLSDYLLDENLNLNFEPLKDFGIKREDGILSARFNYDLERIEEYFMFTKQTSIVFEEQKITFEQNDLILISTTWKPTLNKFKTFIKESGFEIENIEKQDNQVLVLLNPLF